jgi:two-component system chemotaxis response regulator CheY
MPLDDSNVIQIRPKTSGNRPLQILLVEDDFSCQLLLRSFLSRYGQCHIANNGLEAVDAVRSAFSQGKTFDMVCMDIMMPELNGRDAVIQIRKLEEDNCIFSTHGAKIVMTTAVTEIKEVMRCFNSLCDAYLMKPLDLSELLAQMKALQLVA